MINFSERFQALLPNDAHVQDELSALLTPCAKPVDSPSAAWLALQQDHRALWQFCTPLREALGISQRTVLVSLLHKHYCQQQFGPRAAQALLDQPWPAFEDNEQVHLSHDQRQLCWHSDQPIAPAAAQTSLSALMSQIPEQLNVQYRTWRALGIGPGVYWSNAALSLVMPWNLLLGHVRESEQLGQLSQAFLTGFGEKLAAQLQWIGVRQHGLRHWLPKRQGCCLQYQCTQGEGQCGTCSLRSKDEFLTLIAQHYGAIEEDSSPLATPAG
ncbi:hypothetical protein [Atopomonas sediminilitoris]|uniref:hypothetical protein n=1 Tax=Atopomonas sediminilitoris TaxID=2919919 RepID=UPI001F4EB996|nr:hypothetical protein [Atopomonas sediminilitoris]MCJ8170012.1 hypothetical protein [Atopomonas sediminilitoris]